MGKFILGYQFLYNTYTTVAEGTDYSDVDESNSHDNNPTGTVIYYQQQVMKQGLFFSRAENSRLNIDLVTQPSVSGRNYGWLGVVPGLKQKPPKIPFTCKPNTYRPNIL